MIASIASGELMPSKRPELTSRSSPEWPANASSSGTSPSRRLDDPPDRQAELPRELEVALVVGGHGHDRAGAVLHQHVVGTQTGCARR